MVELSHRASRAALAFLALAFVGPALAQPSHRVGPSYLYPAVTATPGVVNPDVTQANINDTLCKSGWTATIRPPASYTTTLKTQQLGTSKFKDNAPSHYEEDHFIFLELGGHRRDPKNLSPQMWGTPATPLTSKAPLPPHLVGAKSKDAVQNALHKEVCAGTLTLHQAQESIRTDWFKYYRDHLLK